MFVLQKKCIDNYIGSANRFAESYHLNPDLSIQKVNPMKTLFAVSCMTLLSLSAQLQEQSKFSLSANFGLNGSFFSASLSDDNEPQGSLTFNEKNFIGKVGGIEGRLTLTNRSHLSFGFTHSENKKEYIYNTSVNAVQVDIYYFTLRHLENIFHAGYAYQFSKRNTGFRAEIGLFYSRQIQQSIDLFSSTVRIAEAKYNPGRFNELGAFIGIQYAKRIDTKFDLGIQSRLFYEFTSNILSQITLTPTLTYHFRKSKRKTTKSTS